MKVLIEQMREQVQNHESTLTTSRMDYPGNLFVVAAPSGAGKSSLVKALRELDSHVMPSVSHTTRPPRGQEKHGREYFFVPAAEFDQMVLADAFVEWANVHGHRYGTSKKAIEDRIAHGADVILEIDWQGALQIKRIYPNAVLIFILPPAGRNCARGWSGAARTGRRSSKPDWRMRLPNWRRQKNSISL
jgi:guanylate kinase